MIKPILAGTLILVAFVAAAFTVGLETTAIGVFGLVLAAFILRFPVCGMMLLVLLLPFNALVSLTAEPGSAFLYGASKDLLLGLLLLGAIARGRLGRVPRAIAMLVLLIVLLPILSSFFTPSFTQALYGWRNNYEPLLLMLAVAALIEPHQIRKVLGTVVFATQVSAAVAIWSWQKGLTWLFDLDLLPVTDPADFPTSLFSQGSLLPRAFSPYTGPNELGLAMLIGIAVVWCAPKIRLPWRLLLSGLPIIAIVFAESRSGLLGLIVLAAVLFARSLRRISAAVSGVFMLMAVAVIGAAATVYIYESLTRATDLSFGGHADSLVEGLMYMALHPLGMGLGIVGPLATQFENYYLVESFWLLIGLESGPIVLILYLALLASLLNRGMRARTRGGYLMAAALAATLVSQIVLPAFQAGPVSYLLWLVVGISLAIQRQEAVEAESPEPETPTAKEAREAAEPAASI